MKIEEKHADSPSNSRQEKIKSTPSIILRQKETSYLAALPHPESADIIHPPNGLENSFSKHDSKRRALFFAASEHIVRRGGVRCLRDFLGFPHLEDVLFCHFWDVERQDGFGMFRLAGARIGAAVASQRDGVKRNFQVALGGQRRGGILISHEQSDAETQKEGENNGDTGDGDRIIHDQRRDGDILLGGVAC